MPEDSVFSLRGRGIEPWELYRQGVIKLQDVPLDSLNLMQRKTFGQAIPLFDGNRAPGAQRRSL